MANSVDVDHALALNDKTEIVPYVLVDVADSSTRNTALRCTEPLKLAKSGFHVIDHVLSGLPSGFVVRGIRSRAKPQWQVVRGHHGRLVWKYFDRRLASNQEPEGDETEDSHAPVNA